jgi:heptosyltransferase-2
MKRVILVAPNWLGDAVMSLPLVGMLARVRGLLVTVIAGGYVGRVYAGIPEVPDLCLIPRSRRLSYMLSCARTVRALTPEAALILPPSFSSALAVFMSLVPLRVGYRSDGRSLLLSSALDPGDPLREHLSRSYLRLGKELLSRLSFPVPSEFSVPAPETFPDEVEAAGRLLESVGAPREGNIVVAPGAAYGGAKSWPLDRFRELCRIVSRDRPVVLVGGGRDIGACRRIASGIEGVFDLSGRTTLGELFAVLGASSLVVANDSGVGHAAASLGVPVIVVFGSTSPAWTAPLGDDVSVIHKPVSCSPCFLRKCPRNLECFTSISPEEVAGEVDSSLKKRRDDVYKPRPAR